jgi:hypothetical protein
MRPGMERALRAAASRLEPCPLARQPLTTTATHNLIAEPGADDARHYRRRVNMLAAEYLALFVGALVGIALLIWKAQLYVTLTQRSNIETLTLAFFLVFFAYLGVLSAPGALGAVRIARYAILARLTRDHDTLERQKMRALGVAGSGAAANLNVVLEVDAHPGEDFEIPVGDRAGLMGHMHVGGSRIQHLPVHKDGSSDLLAYFHAQVVKLLQERGGGQPVEIVAWKKIDDEATEQYHAIVEFARNLERQLGKGDLWPKVRLNAADCAELERRLSAICSPLRDEGFLPQWDYQGEHKLPIIPEPLGLVSLTRNEQRVDPVSSMGCAVWVVIAAVVMLALFIVFPPWVPGV